MTNQVQEVKQAVDIVDIIGERVSLQRAGRSYKAPCPFHSEKSPSFFVTPDLQVFRCFGCGEKGDVFTFLERYEGLTFYESLQLLADRAGITLEKSAPKPEDQQRARILEILEVTAEYFHYLLTKHELGKPGREYLTSRKTKPETVELFKVGYSLESWQGLLHFLVQKKKFHVSDILAAGLIIPRGNANWQSQNVNDFYDRFRNRLMFPLTDHRGRVVGFSGRLLDKNAKEAKYINSPETSLYHKSELLFGFSQLYRSIREANSVIIVEGEFDVLSSYQAHVQNVVAIKGSALTKEHVERLRRTVDTVILSLDADSAGIEATKRAIEVAQPFNLRLRVLPSQNLGGKDPDDVAREDPKAWREHAKNSVSVYDFLIDVALQQHDKETGEGKQAIVSAVGPIIMGIDHAVERSHYITALAQKIGVMESILQQDLQRIQLKQQAPVKPVADDALPVLSNQHKLEFHVLHLLVQFPESEVIERAKELDASVFSHPGLKLIVERLQKFTANAFSMKKFASTLDAELQTVLSQVYFETETVEVTDEKEFTKMIKRLKQVGVQEEMKQVTTKLAELESLSEMTPTQEAEYQRLLGSLVQLKSQYVGR